MSHEDNEILSELESALASLAPKSSELQLGAERDRLMYLAGRASVETKAAPRRRLSVLAWPLTTAVMALIALSLAALLLHERQLHHQRLAAKSEQRQGQTVGPSNREESPADEQLHATREDSSSQSVKDGSRTASAVASYVHLRRRILSEGVDALPGAGDTASPSPRNMLTPRSALEALDG
jgi:hypothetical protein